MLRRAGLLALLALLAPGAAGAWSGPVHEVVCEIAWQRLSPEARAFVRELRHAGGDPAATFAASCSWADEVRRTTHRSTYEYHFLNVPRGADAVDLDRDCPALDCLPVAIRRYASYLAREPRREREQVRRLDALRFLGHFVADLHQPFHVAWAEDAGGNAVAVRFFGEPTNLHAVWDTAIPERAGLAGPAVARRLAADIPAADAASWAGFDVAAWTQETYELALDAYRIPEDGEIGAAYYERARPVMERQVRKAGVRLAFLIEAAARGELPPLVW